MSSEKIQEKIRWGIANFVSWKSIVVLNNESEQAL